MSFPPPLGRVSLVSTSISCFEEEKKKLGMLTDIVRLKRRIKSKVADLKASYGDSSNQTARVQLLVKVTNYNNKTLLNTTAYTRSSTLEIIDRHILNEKCVWHLHMYERALRGRWVPLHMPPTPPSHIVSPTEPHVYEYSVCMYE